MRLIYLMLFSCLLIAFVARPSLADMATPWVENAKVGDESEHQAWVISVDAEQSTYNVLVLTDRHQPVLLQATAEKGVVPATVLGRLATVKAKVTKQEPGVTEIQILKVTPVPAEKK